MAVPENTIWPGLLRWSLTQSDGLTSAADIRPLSDEDRKFIQDAYESLVIDEAKRMKIITEILKMPETADGILSMLRSKNDALKPIADVRRGANEEGKGNSNPPTKDSKDKQTGESIVQGVANHIPLDSNELISSGLLDEIIQRKLGALEELDDRVLTVDNANDLYTIGGVKPLISTLKSSHPALQWRAAQVLATANQNNPKGQKLSASLGAVEVLVELLEENQNQNIPRTEEEWKVIVKSLYALSAILREVEPNSGGQEKFFQTHGIQAIVNLINNLEAGERVHVKALSLLKYLISVNDSARSNCISIDSLWSTLSNSLSRSQSLGIQMREELIQLIIEFSKVKSGRDRIRESQWEFESKIKQRIEEIIKIQSNEGIPSGESEYEGEKKLLIKLAKTCLWKP